MGSDSTDCGSIGINANLIIENETLKAKLAAAEAKISKLDRCLCFFASVIRSGERWSEVCESEFDAARAEGGE